MLVFFYVAIEEHDLILTISFNAYRIITNNFNATPLILPISYILVMHQQNEQHINFNELVCNNPQSKYLEAAYWNRPYTMIVTRTKDV